MRGAHALKRPGKPGEDPRPRPATPLRHGSDGGGARPSAAAQLATLGVWIATAPIGMLFLAFGSAYVVRRGLGQQWIAVALPALVWVNTAVLLASSITLEVGRRALRRGRADGRWIVGTFLLGLTFLAGQVAAWIQLTAAGVGVATTAYGSFFYVLTAVHGLHLLLGVGGMGTASAWPREAGWRGVSRADAVKVAAIYWHFMTLIWIGVLILLVLGR